MTARSANEAPRILNTVVAVALISLCGVITLIALSAPRRPRFAQLALLTVAAFRPTNKVWSPQYSLWLIPLAVLAVPRWKPLLADDGRCGPVVPADALLAGHRGRRLDGGAADLHADRARPPRAGAVRVVVYESYHPARDLVRRSGDDDPTGGVLRMRPTRSY